MLCDFRRRVIFFQVVLSIVLQIKKFFLVKILTCILVPSDSKIHDVGSEEESTYVVVVVR